MNIIIRSSRAPRKKANNPQVENHWLKKVLELFFNVIFMLKLALNKSKSVAS